MERNSPKDLVSFLLGFLQRKTRNWRNSPAFSVYIQQKCSNLTASNCTRVSAERVGLRAQLIYLFEPLCVWSHWHPLKKGSALFPLVSPTKGEAFIFISYPKYPKREAWGHVWTQNTCMCFGLDKYKTKRNQKRKYMWNIKANCGEARLNHSVRGTSHCISIFLSPNRSAV